MKLHEYKQIIMEIDTADYQDFLKNPKKLIKLFVKIQGVPIIPDKTLRIEGVANQPARRWELSNLCNILCLPTGTDWSAYSVDEATELANRVRGWYDQQMADRRAKKIVRLAWVSVLAATISAACALVAVLNNPQAVEWFISIFGK